MTSLPTMMPASEIAAHHEPTPCDLCHTTPATLLVRCDVKRYASFRCDEHAQTAMADLQADGSFVNAFPLRKPYSVEQADRIATDSGEDFPATEPETCRHCKVVLTDENTHPRLGCCVDCQETARAEWKEWRDE